MQQKSAQQGSRWKDCTGCERCDGRRSERTKRDTRCEQLAPQAVVLCDDNGVHSGSWADLSSFFTKSLEVVGQPGCRARKFCQLARTECVPNTSPYQQQLEGNGERKCTRR